jgi:hypothetical protein
VGKRCGSHGSVESGRQVKERGRLETAEIRPYVLVGRRLSQRKIGERKCPQADQPHRKKKGGYRRPLGHRRTGGCCTTHFISMHHKAEAMLRTMVLMVLPKKCSKI